MNFRHIGLGVIAGIGAFVIGFTIGMSVYMVEPCGLVIPGEFFAGAFPGLRAWFRNLIPGATHTFEAA